LSCYFSLLAAASSSVQCRDTTSCRLRSSGAVPSVCLHSGQHHTLRVALFCQTYVCGYSGPLHWFGVRLCVHARTCVAVLVIAQCRPHELSFIACNRFCEWEGLLLKTAWTQAPKAICNWCTFYTLYLKRTEHLMDKVRSIWKFGSAATSRRALVFDPMPACTL